MAFVSDSTSIRTFDNERGFELRVISGGSDGSKIFEIFEIDNPGNVLSSFTAILKSRPSTEAERQENADITEVSTWTVLCSNPPRFEIPGIDTQETLAVLEEAFTSFKAVHGLGPVGTKYKLESSSFFAA